MLLGLIFLRTNMERKKEGETKFQACTSEIHKEMHPNFLLVKNFVRGERDIAPSSFTISIITSFSITLIYRNTDTITLLC